MQSSKIKLNNYIQGAIAIILGAGIWGLFWIPLRYLDESGIEGLWAVALVLGAAAIVSIPTIIPVWRKLAHAPGTLTILGTGIGASATLYFAGVIFSDVIRVIFLFYLLPIWATLCARVIYGEAIKPRSMVAIALALVGLYLLLGSDGGLPLPKNLGDWMGLAAGFLWGLCLTILHSNSDIDSRLGTAAPFVFGAPIAAAFAFVGYVVSPEQFSAFPPIENLWPVLFAAFAFGALMLWPSMFGQVWGAMRVPAPTAALLTMSEILVAVSSAWLLLGNNLSNLSMMGGVIILIGAVVDLYEPAQKRNQ